MKKKVLAVVIIASFIGWFSYRFFNRPSMQKPAAETKLTLDWENLDKKPEEPQTLQKKPLRPEQKVRVHETMTPTEEEKFEAYDQMEKKWLGKVKEILESRHYDIYLDMREQNDKEKLEAYKEYHEFLRKKHGDQFSYKISEDQSTREKAINQKYLKELLALIGEQKFAEYLKARDAVNEEYRRNNKPFIQIEF